MVAAEIMAGVSGFQAMYNAAKALKDMNDASVRYGAVIELQEKILAAQEQQAALINRVGDLEKEVASLKAWEAEKQRYELKDIGNGNLVYSIKPEMQGAEPPHNLCANCFNQSKKRHLQTEYYFVGRARAYLCHDCGSRLYTSGHYHPEHDGKKP